MSSEEKFLRLDPADQEVTYSEDTRAPAAQGRDLIEKNAMVERILSFTKQGLLGRIRFRNEDTPERQLEVVRSAAGRKNIEVSQKADDPLSPLSEYEKKVLRREQRRLQELYTHLASSHGELGEMITAQVQRVVDGLWRFLGVEE